jgi:peptide chain release factor 1
MELLQKLEQINERYEFLSEEMARPEIVTDPDKLGKIAKEQSDLGELVKVYQALSRINSEIEEYERVLQDGKDNELMELAREELPQFKSQKERLENEASILLVPKDPNDDRNCFLEIRAGTGGEEASLFAADLFRSYCRYAEIRGWRIEMMSSSDSATGGLKEVIALIHGKGAFSSLKHEKGVHRVQRVPTTESQGRIHTSAVTVAVLPEAEDLEVDIDPKDLKVDVYRSSGPGGQSVNTTDSAVRITHLPTGLVVTCQDEKSQHKNKAKAMKILKARLLEALEEQRQSELSAERRSQVGSGDRSERIRTYNFPQNRVTDHRVGLTIYKLGDILEGKLDELIDPLKLHFQTEALKSEALN